MNNEMPEVKKITIEYADGSEKIVERGVCFSVHEKDGMIYVKSDGMAGSKYDEIAILAIIGRIAKEVGISEEIYEKVVDQNE